MKIRLSKDSKAWKKFIDLGAEYLVFEGNEAVLYDKDGKELCREKDILRESFHSDISEQ